MKMLLVDDDTELTGMLAKYLAGESFYAAAGGTVVAGCAAALSGAYDAVISM